MLLQLFPILYPLRTAKKQLKQEDGFGGLGLLLFFFGVYIFTPSKKDALLIIAGGQTLNYLTTNETAKKLPDEALNFVVTELKSMAADAKVELGIQSQKEKILEEAKKLSSQELIEKMKVDTTLVKIVLGK